MFRKRCKCPEYHTNWVYWKHVVDNKLMHCSNCGGKEYYFRSDYELSLLGIVVNGWGISERFIPYHNKKMKFDINRLWEYIEGMR